MLRVTALGLRTLGRRAAPRHAPASSVRPAERDEVGCRSSSRNLPPELSSKFAKTQKTYIHTHAYVYMCTYTCVHSYIYIYTYLHSCIVICVCIHTHICVYTDTCICQASGVPVSSQLTGLGFVKSPEKVAELQPGSQG